MIFEARVDKALLIINAIWQNFFKDFCLSKILENCELKIKSTAIGNQPRLINFLTREPSHSNSKVFPSKLYFVRAAHLNAILRSYIPIHRPNQNRKRKIPAYLCTSAKPWSKGITCLSKASLSATAENDGTNQLSKLMKINVRQDVEEKLCNESEGEFKRLWNSNRTIHCLKN